MAGHCAPAWHCPSPAASLAPPIAVHHSRSSIISRSDSKARLIADLHDDKSYKRFRYFGVAGFMFMMSLIVAFSVWPDWQDSLIVAIMFSYCTAMLLLFLKHFDNMDAQGALELNRPPPCEESGVVVVLFLVVSGIMVISMALIISIFPSKSDDADIIVFFSLLSFVLSLLLLIEWEHNHKKKRERKAALQDLKKRPPI